MGSLAFKRHFSNNNNQSQPSVSRVNSNMSNVSKSTTKIHAAAVGERKKTLVDKENGIAKDWIKEKERLATECVNENAGEEDIAKQGSSPDMKVAKTPYPKSYPSGYVIPRKKESVGEQESLNESIRKTLLRLSPSNNSRLSPCNSSMEDNWSALPSDSSPLYRPAAATQGKSVRSITDRINATGNYIKNNNKAMMMKKKPLASSSSSSSSAWDTSGELFRPGGRVDHHSVGYNSGQDIKNPTEKRFRLKISRYEEKPEDKKFEDIVYGSQSDSADIFSQEG